MKLDDSVIEQVLKNQETIQKMIAPLSTTILDSHENLMKSVSSAALNMSEGLKINLPQIDISPLTQAIKYNEHLFNNVSHLGELMSSSVFNVLDSYQSSFDNIVRISKQYQKDLRLSQSIYSDLMKSLFASVGPLDSTFAQISSIDFSGLEELAIDDFVENRHHDGHSDLSATITVTKTEKKLGDMTASEFQELLKKYITPKGNFAIGSFLLFVFNDYAKDVALVVMEIVFAFAITFMTGQFNAEVIEEVGNRIEETKTYKDARKIVTRYVKANPTEQIGFLRKDSVLREGASKNAPVVSQTPITTKVVLAIIDRKQNWLRVEINTGNSCGEIGWIQESKVIKFKRVD